MILLLASLSNISPQSKPTETRLILVRNLWNIILLVTSFVKASTIWSPDDTRQTSKSLIATFSLTKWKPILMCFVRAWNTCLPFQRVGKKCDAHFNDVSMFPLGIAILLRGIGIRNMMKNSLVRKILLRRWYSPPPSDWTTKILELNNRSTCV
jgi:hypothetical protein